MLIDYTVDSVDYCAVAVQIMPRMPFDETLERHFYFGNTFFKNFVGVFNQTAGQMGMAKSSRAASSVELICPGSSCAEPEPEPTPEPEPDPTPEPPEPTPDPDPTPAPDPTPSDSGDENLMWLWIVIGLSCLLVIVMAIAVYYCRRAQKSEDLNAILYAQTAGGEGAPMIGHSGDMIAHDIEVDASGKREARKSHFADHADIMRETGISSDPIRHQINPGHVQDRPRCVRLTSSSVLCCLQIQTN